MTTDVNGTNITITTTTSTTEEPVEPEPVVGISQAMVFKFSETITTERCTGEVSFLPLDWNHSSDVMTIPCNELVTWGDERAVILPDQYTFNPDVEYTLRFSRGSIRDLAGNPIPFTDTESL